MENGIALCRREKNDCSKKDKCLRFTQITGETEFINFIARLDKDDGFDCFFSNGNNKVVETELNTNNGNNNTEAKDNG